MEWQDDAIVLSTRPHGEGSAVVSVLTREHGRHAGLVQGVRGKSGRGLYEISNRLTIDWRARWEDQLGRFSGRKRLGCSPALDEVALVEFGHQLRPDGEDQPPRTG